MAEARNEPIRTVERRVVEHATSLYVNTPNLATDILDLKKGDTVRVETHDDRVVIRPTEE